MNRSLLDLDLDVEGSPCSTTITSGTSTPATHSAVGRPKGGHGHRQVTDTDLLALAVDRGAAFVTFDTRIDVAAVPCASAAHLVVR